MQHALAEQRRLGGDEHIVERRDLGAEHGVERRALGGVGVGLGRVDLRELRLLLQQRGVSIKQKNAQGYTPMSIALEFMCGIATRLLQIYKLSPDQVNDKSSGHGTKFHIRIQTCSCDISFSIIRNTS